MTSTTKRLPVEKPVKLETPQDVSVELPESELSEPVGASVVVPAATRGPASTSMSSVGSSSDLSFAREAERAVEMGIITRSEMSAYIEEHKIAAQQQEERLEEEMSYSLDEEPATEQQF